MFYAPWVYPADRYYYGCYDSPPPELPPSDHEIRFTVGVVDVSNQLQLATRR